MTVILSMIAACVVGFAMTWGVGANDLANIISTTMGSKAISMRNAFVVAVVFELAGAFLGGSHVTNTVGRGLIHLSLLGDTPYIVIDGMLSLLTAGALWMAVASFLGMPVSITNAIVGGLVGFGAIVFGMGAIHWQVVQTIAVSWVCSPLLAGIASLLLFNSIRWSILRMAKPVKQANYCLPIYFFLTGIILAIMMVLKGAHHIGWHFSYCTSTVIVIITAVIVTLLGMTLTGKHCNLQQQSSRHEQFRQIERAFGLLMAFTASIMVFAHGSNDVAVAMGPIVAIFSIIHGQLTSHTFPAWITLLGVIGVVVGLVTYGRKVIMTVGSNITTLTPSRAFAATLAAASTVIVSTSLGIPVSATQTLVGGVLGVGLARGIGALNLNVVRNILLSWVITIPATAILAILFFYIIRAMTVNT